jgi:hypothetical protein
MELIYSDESGTSFEKKDDQSFRDGEFVIYGGFSVDENKSWHLERTIFNIAKDIFKFDNIKDFELHAGDIFWGERSFKRFTREKRYEFFNETIQFLAKYGVNIYLGLMYKKSKIFEKPVEFIGASMECSLNLVEQNLSNMAKNGILIADMSEEIKGKRRKPDLWEFLDNSKLEGRREGPRIEIILKRILFATQSWKEIFISIPHTPFFNRKYKFEKRSHYLFDNIHYVDSKTSIFTQLADILLFIINRIFSYTTLKYYEQKTPEYEYALDEASTSILFKTNIHTATMFRCPDDTLDLQYLPHDLFYPFGRGFRPVFFEHVFVKGIPYRETPRPI